MHITMSNEILKVCPFCKKDKKNLSVVCPIHILISPEKSIEEYVGYKGIDW